MTEISPDRVKTQLERILASSSFLSSRRLSQFLKYVVDKTLSGQSDGIKQYTIGVDAMELGAEFDPQSNPTVRIHARKLRRQLEKYYLNEGKEEPIRIGIPVGRYVPFFCENRAATQGPGHADRQASADAVTLVSSMPTIAVIQFENLNESDGRGFLAKGLTSEILISLTRFTELAVLGPLEKEADYSSLYQDFGARFILQGAVRSNGSRIRITTDLTDAATKNKHWGKSFEYDLEKVSLFEIEDQVTSQVAGAIADGLGVVFRALRNESYVNHLKLNEVTLAVLKYNTMWMTHAPQDFVSALQSIEDALVAQPDSALMIALKSNVYYGDVMHDLHMVPGSRSKMESLALKAVSLDPNLQIGRYNLVVQNAFWGRREACVYEAREVIAMNPNHSRILAGSAVAVTTVGDYDYGKELIERAKRLNPHYPSWYHFVDYVAYFGNKQYEKAWIEARKIHMEGLLWHSLLRASALGKLGRVKEAETFVDELLHRKPDFPKRPREYIKPLFVTDEHVEMIWDGLRKAGIKELQ